MVSRLAFCFVMLSSIAFADHLPQHLIARGKVETALCGVDVHRSTLSELRERWGVPKSFEEYPKTEEAAEITWDKEGSLIHATINADHIAYAVELSGKRSPIAQTGSGLKLGQRLEDLRRVYGSRFLQKGNVVTVQWESGTELRATLAAGKIVSLLLIASVE